MKWKRNSCRHAYSVLSSRKEWYPIGKNLGSRHATVAFFTRSVPILTPTGVNKRQFYDDFLIRITILLHNSRKLVAFTLVGTDIGVQQYPYESHLRNQRPILLHDRRKSVVFTPVVNEISRQFT